jgi:hypothetical protein
MYEFRTSYTSIKFVATEGYESTLDSIIEEIQCKRELKIEFLYVKLIQRDILLFGIF